MPGIGQIRYNKDEKQGYLDHIEKQEKTCRAQIESLRNGKQTIINEKQTIIDDLRQQLRKLSAPPAVPSAPPAVPPAPPAVPSAPPEPEPEPEPGAWGDVTTPNAHEPGWFKGHCDVIEGGLRPKNLDQIVTMEVKYMKAGGLTGWIGKKINGTEQTGTLNFISASECSLTEHGDGGDLLYKSGNPILIKDRQADKQGEKDVNERIYPYKLDNLTGNIAIWFRPVCEQQLITEQERNQALGNAIESYYDELEIESWANASKSRTLDSIDTDNLQLARKLKRGTPIGTADETRIRELISYG